MKKSLFTLSFFFLTMASTVYGQAPYSGNSGMIGGFVIGIIIFVVVLFLIRELLCWYWKINKMIELQQNTTMILFKIYEQNGGKVDWDLINKTIYK